MALQAAQWPSSPVPEPTKTILARFFEVGDSNSNDAGRILGEEIFTADGQIVVNKRVINGTEELANSSHLPEGLDSRRHEIERIYTCNEAADDLMLIGKVFWTFKNGEVRDGRFAARAVVMMVENRARLKLYQGWADLSELMAMLQQQ